MHSIVKSEKKYKIITKDMKNDEKAICEDDSLEIQKKDEKTYIIVAKKGSLKRIR